MFYYDQQSALIEICVTSDNQFLIGNKTYDSIPDDILSLAFISTNWNRALKYKVKIENQDIIKTGYFIINFDIYLDFKNNEIKLLAKNYFAQDIVDQVTFKSDFMNLVFENRDKHKILLSDKNVTKEIIEKYHVTNSDKNFKSKEADQFIVKDNFDFINYKFKNLFVLSKDNKIEITNREQRIYYLPISEFKIYDEVINLIDYIDLNQHMFYFNTKLTNFENNILMEFKFSSKEINKLLKVKIFELVNKYEEGNAKYLHLFNITNDLNYLEKFLNIIFDNNDFNIAITVIDEIFKEVKLNYYSWIFKNKNLLKILTNHIKNEEDEKIVETLKSRYK